MLDFFTYLTTKWIQGFRRINEISAPGRYLIDEDGLPTLKDFTVPTARLARKIHLTLAFLRLPTDLHLKCEASKPLEKIAGDLSSRASHVTRAAKAVQQEVAVYYNDKVTRSNLRESQAVKRLAILASTFLPLSLGTWLLSMQNRFRDVHLVLWDYVAISIDIGVIVVLFFWITGPFRLPRLVPWFSKKVLRMDSEPTWRQEKKKRVRHIVWWLLILPLYALSIVAVNMGLFGSVEVAWKVVGYGVAGAIGFLILGGILYVILSLAWHFLHYFDD
jgi:hypothetical protein